MFPLYDVMFLCMYMFVCLCLFIFAAVGGLRLLKVLKNMINNVSLA
jgi:hypothetical protein